LTLLSKGTTDSTIKKFTLADAKTLRPITYRQGYGIPLPVGYADCINT